MVELAVIPPRPMGFLSARIGIRWASANALTSRRKRLPMLPNSAADGIGLPRCRVMNRTTCPPTCRFGTYAFRYSRSTHSTSSATWPSRTSLMFATPAVPAIAPASTTRAGFAGPAPRAATRGRPGGGPDPLPLTLMEGGSVKSQRRMPAAGRASLSAEGAAGLAGARRAVRLLYADRHCRTGFRRESPLSKDRA